MRIAVLLVGRTTDIPGLTERILRNYSNSNNDTVDFFAHTWSDDFDNIDYNIIEQSIADGVHPPMDVFRSVLRPIDHTARIEQFSPVSYTTSSYNELIDHYIQDCDVVPVGSELTYMSRLAPYLSFDYAKRLLLQHSINNNIEYDLVIKWRYDAVRDEQTVYRLAHWWSYYGNTNTFYVTGMPGSDSYYDISFAYSGNLDPDLYTSYRNTLVTHLQNTTNKDGLYAMFVAERALYHTLANYDFNLSVGEFKHVIGAICRTPEHVKLGVRDIGAVPWHTEWSRNLY